MGQVVQFLQRHTGGMLRATGYSHSSYCWLLGTATRWRAAKPTEISDSPFLSPSHSLTFFSHSISSTKGAEGPLSEHGDAQRHVCPSIYIQFLAFEDIVLPLPLIPGGKKVKRSKFGSLLSLALCGSTLASGEQTVWNNLSPPDLFQSFFLCYVFAIRSSSPLVLAP